MSPSWNLQLRTLFQIVPNLRHLQSKLTAKSNMKLRPSLTPRSTTDRSAGYCTLSTGQGMKVQTKNTPGCQLQNSNTLKNSYRTSTPNTHGSPVPSRFDSPTPTSSNTHSPFKKTSLPIHSTPFHSSPHHLTLTISCKTNPVHSNNIPPLPTSPQKHYPPSLSFHSIYSHIPRHSLPSTTKSMQP
jgi:hypothetical protein